MNTLDVVYIIISLLITFPISHVFLKKATTMDFNYTEEKQKDLSKFFYIPYLNVVIYFFYLLWVIITFKRP